MKRKRKEVCASPVLDDSPKRIKVQAQRKFAQNSGVNSPSLTPIRDFDSVDLPNSNNLLPEPVELLPIKRPNTEDFLTFLCFRGTPILPTNLQFFNTASIVTDGQVHKIKEESPKNGPIDIGKCAAGNSSEKPFIAFGVRKRADPVIISKQMEKKRRHALAIQALRRKYQEQKMAKIRALTISKLSEKTTNKTLVKTNTIQKTEKTETLTKQTNNKTQQVQKTKVIATKHVKVTTHHQSLKTNIKPRMCLRSFRGKFVPNELTFRSRRNSINSDDNEEKTPNNDINNKRNNTRSKSEEKTTPESKRRIDSSTSTKRLQVKRRILLPSTTTITTIVKPKLRSTTVKKTVISRRKARQRLQTNITRNKDIVRRCSDASKKSTAAASSPKSSEETEKADISKRITRRDSELLKKETTIASTTKKIVQKNLRKSNNELNEKLITKKTVTTRKSEEIKSRTTTPPSLASSSSVKRKKNHKTSSTTDSSVTNSKKKNANEDKIKKEQNEFCKKIQDIIDTALKDAEKEDAEDELVVNNIEDSKKSNDSPVPLNKKKEISQRSNNNNNNNNNKRSSVSSASARPTRKTKEAAAIYMELLSHKLVNNDAIDDDDNISIDSFPELPNVKRTEQREIELKAQVKTSMKQTDDDDDESNNDDDESDIILPINTKRKINLLTSSSSSSSDTVSDEEASEEKKVLPSKVRKNEPHHHRQTRRSKISDFSESDESFRVDIRISRKKIVTRSRNCRNFENKNVNIILDGAKISDDEEEEEDVDEEEEEISDESSVNLKSLQAKEKNRKNTKDLSFSDSDEEPLSKLTTTNKSIKSTNATEDSSKLNKLRKTAVADKIIVGGKNAAATTTVMEPKPKRECTKRPSNYLAMLSSSEEDEDQEEEEVEVEAAAEEEVVEVEDEEEPSAYFQQELKIEAVEEEIKSNKNFVQSLDLLAKDLGRKEKVNMSNEQIEQWLKDSALAGSSVAKENDEMLKFGEKLPPKVDDDDDDDDDDETKEIIIQNNKDVVNDKDMMKLPSLIVDRKLIFKKDKKDTGPNKNAFSPENELSVYAFGEENEEVIPSTPFRRPSRRPSSTATSRSEDDQLSKIDEGLFRKPNPSDSEDSRCFHVPHNPKTLRSSRFSDSMVPPFNKRHQISSAKSTENLLVLDRVPSSPSAASSSSSVKFCKKLPTKLKLLNETPILKVADFPKPTEPAKLVEAPVFHPTEQEFQDPLEYIERIRAKAESFGICKIVPPKNFKPECKVTDDMRFTAYNQYVHKMLHRWGANFKEFLAIKRYLTTQSIALKTPPLIGGMEIDLPRLYQTVQSLGGLKEVIEKKKWSKVSDAMKIPKSAQDRVTKLDDIYCKYLLPYDTLSPVEREKLFQEVESYWLKKEAAANLNSINSEDDSSSSHDEEDDDEDEDLAECTVKGKNMALNAFYRIARNTMAMYFKTGPNNETIQAQEIEQDFWRYVTEKQNHICVHSASIDCGTWGYGFAVAKNSPFAKHPWNLKVLSNNNGSVLRSLGPVMGVTVPTLHVGMVFSACCWYRDPHGLPWLEYLHTGGNKIWYGIPSNSCDVFRSAMKKLVPNYCRDKELWLPSDTAMVPPSMLLENNVSLCKTIQEPGQFMVVFPKVYTSSISTGYVVSESVYFAPLYWLQTAKSLFNDLKNSCEPSMFSLDKLFICIVNDTRSSVEALKVIAPFVEDLCKQEIDLRKRLKNCGTLQEERIPPVEFANKKKIQSVDGDFECEICRINLYVSMIVDTQEDLIYCLEHAVELVEKDTKLIEHFKLRFNLDEQEIAMIPNKVADLLQSKLQKIDKITAALPTSVTKELNK